MYLLLNYSSSLMHSQELLIVSMEAFRRRKVAEEESYFAELMLARGLFPVSLSPLRMTMATKSRDNVVDAETIIYVFYSFYEKQAR